jgi:hypothetical protein
MPKKPVSLTLEEANLLWLKGRARIQTGGSISEAVDQLIAEARTGRLGASQAPRSVVGTIDLADDPTLSGADAAVRDLFAASLARPFTLHEAPGSAYGTTAPRTKKTLGKRTRG